MTVHLAKETASVEFGVAAQFLKESGISSLHISAHDFEVVGQGLSSRFIAQGEDTVRNNSTHEAMLTAVGIELGAQETFGVSADEGHCTATAGCYTKRDETVSHDEVMGKELDAWSLGSPLQAVLRYESMLLEMMEAASAQGVDRLPAMREGGVFTVEDDGDVEAFHVAVGEEFLKASLKSSERQRRMGQMLKMVASGEAVLMNEVE